jgi:hypothetical protein
MHCMDCLAASERQTAVGICTQCGAAVCVRHAQVGQQLLACTKPVYRTVVTEPAVRRLLCATCAAAHAAHASCCPQDESVIRTS